MFYCHHFSTLLLEYAIRIQANQEGLKLNGTLQLLIYTDNVNLLGEGIHIIYKNTDTLEVPSQETGLEVNAEKTMFMSYEQNA
jgi:hypothetical protein